MDNYDSGILATADREIVGTRLFDAPRDLVFQMWIDPEHLKKWWGPDGFSLTIHEIDVRPGGHWRFIMHGPDGTDYNNHVVYLEVVRPERIVYRHKPEKGAQAVDFKTTVTFADEGKKTRLTMRALFPTAAAREYVIMRYGAIEGMNQTLGRLVQMVDTLTKEGR